MTGLSTSIESILSVVLRALGGAYKVYRTKAGRKLVGSLMADPAFANVRSYLDDHGGVREQANR